MEHGFENALKFSSAFECGNLKFATMISDSVYELWMNKDTNSRGHTQWYYFAVTGARRGQEVTFRISNFFKRKLLYRKGKVPFFWSEKSGKGWEQTPSGKATFTCHTDQQRTKKWYTLSFNHTFQHGDVVFFAYGLPYTYSHHLSLIRSLSHHPTISQITRVAKFCTSLGGHACHKVVISDAFKQGRARSNSKESKDSLAISDKSKEKEKSKEKDKEVDKRDKDDEEIDDLHGSDKDKSVIVLMARQHPGETHGSWILHGMLRFLVGDSAIAQGLRKKYTFVAIPMVNIDGVVRGNSRCSLAGVDLNRQWHAPDRSVHPIVYSIKCLMKRLSSKYRVLAAIDFHGHSARRDVFFYGCPFRKPKDHDEAEVAKEKSTKKTKKKKEKGDTENSLNSSGNSKTFNSSGNSNLQEIEKEKTIVVEQSTKRKFRPPPHRDVTVLPRIASWLCPDFSMAKCIFDIQKYKINTARAVIYHQMGVEHCFTVEASMCGTSSYPVREAGQDLPPESLFSPDQLEEALGLRNLGQQFNQMRLATLGIAMSHALHWFFELHTVPFSFVPEEAKGVALKVEELEKEKAEDSAGDSDGEEEKDKKDEKDAENAKQEVEEDTKTQPIATIENGAMSCPEPSKKKTQVEQENNDYSADALHVQSDRVLGIEPGSARYLQLRKVRPYISQCRRAPIRHALERPCKDGPLFDTDTMDDVESILNTKQLLTTTKTNQCSL